MPLPIGAGPSAALWSRLPTYPHVPYPHTCNARVDPPALRTVLFVALFVFFNGKLCFARQKIKRKLASQPILTRLAPRARLTAYLLCDCVAV